MKTILYRILLLMIALTGINTFAQNNHFIQNGVIEFEKKSNMYALITKKIKGETDSYYQAAFEGYKKTNPQFKTVKSTLSFSKNKSLYKWDETNQSTTNNWIADDAMANLKNIIATDLDTQTSITQKNIYDDLYLVKDSLRKINWKITDETREIAGYECRRANAIILDSVYVVAYYTIQIPFSGGPESFTGLPGTILGLAMPHENMTWFATKVTEITVPEKDLAPPTKGKPTDNKELNKTLLEALKDWGKWARKTLQAYSL
ncbi:GLPGLI family protein [Flavobacterium sp. GA093]|uniref:GLPGLI family protein n=1 Tax=Flavobacterium hydrocarbonoxydans TaxID=2683249 RepID=A0A6I4NFJ5_9FLAO|nr:GLPGLI family protein [Flavobacterium hydrocarbonoxydans]MWB93326.1 GLPGLI family protein [Flavobacterium hydrocarbonoxydans]